MSAPQEFQAWMKAVQAGAETSLDRFLPPADQVPAKLHEAMRYTVLGGGKRVRPLLVHASGALFGPDDDALARAASAVEMIHVYSLVHDDMPCMDDDDLRRGKPTVHVAYDEATALLVGDALQAQAFEVLAGTTTVPAARVVTMLRLLAEAAGSAGMCGGQAIDLDSVGISLTLEQLERMHQLKTGAMLRVSVLLGALAGVLEFIPLVGPLAVAIVASIVAALHAPVLVLWTAGFLAAFRVVEDYVIYPRLIRRGIPLHPLAVILAVLAGAELLGVAGMFLAVPVVGILLVVYRHSVEWRRGDVTDGAGRLANGAT